MKNDEMVIKARNVYDFLKHAKAPKDIRLQFKEMMDELQKQINIPRDVVWENNSRLWQPDDTDQYEND